VCVYLCVFIFSSHKQHYYRIIGTDTNNIPILSEIKDLFEDFFFFYVAVSIFLFSWDTVQFNWWDKSATLLITRIDKNSSRGV
jgi:hypothetical protein